ncbi:MAG: hypothetical protein Q8L80_10175 [Gallionella sp.]|nr:hypothetical protein [Gallionella sp.]
MNKHPILVVQEIIKKYGTDIKFEFSHYIYVPQTIDDQRIIFSVSAKDLTRIKLEELCNSTPPGTELALHSKVLLPDQTVMHIPMIDLATRATGIIGRVIDVLPLELSASMIWFESGRSFHGYGTVLISQDDWVKFMGRLLLVNLPQLPPVVDPRWIGHRLISGYSALRWTKNTGHYLQKPILAKNAHLIVGAPTKGQ